MPNNKKQHYVPKFYLRNFSAPGGKVINLHNFKSRKTILNSALSNQCYVDYFYGKDLVVEKGLGEFEGLAASLFRKIISTGWLPSPYSDEHHVLVMFISMQHGRTKHAAEESEAFTDYAAKAVLRRSPEFQDINIDDYIISSECPAFMPLHVALNMCIFLLDLRIKLLVNKTAQPFITSDNPLVMYNQYMDEITYASTNGFASTGLQIFLPLSPDMMLIMYDDSVYRVGGNRHNAVELFSEEEVSRLNKLQWLNALENIYFSPQSGVAQIEEYVARYTPDRDDELAKIQEYPTGNETGTEAIIHVKKHQLHTGLNVRFISVREAKAKTHLEDREPFSVRDPQLMEIFSSFQEQSAAGNFFDYLRQQDAHAQPAGV